MVFSLRTFAEERPIAVVGFVSAVIAVKSVGGYAVEAEAQHFYINPLECRCKTTVRVISVLNLSRNTGSTHLLSTSLACSLFEISIHCSSKSTPDPLHSELIRVASCA